MTTSDIRKRMGHATVLCIFLIATLGVLHLVIKGVIVVLIIYVTYLYWVTRQGET